MSRRKTWTDEQLVVAVRKSRSFRETLIALGLVPAGGNYVHVQAAIDRLDLDVSHFTSKGWNIGLAFAPKQAVPLETLLIRNSQV